MTEPETPLPDENPDGREPPPSEDESPAADPRARREWAAADALLEGQPTELGE